MVHLSLEGKDCKNCVRIRFLPRKKYIKVKENNFLGERFRDSNAL